MPRKPNGQAAEPKQLTDMSKVPDSLRDRWHRARKAVRNQGKGRPAHGQQLKLEHVKAALVAARGNVLYASEMLGCTRTNVYLWIQRQPELQKLQSQLVEEELDDHEGALRYLALEELNPTAILATLNAKGSSRGWSRGGAPARIDGSPAAFGSAGDTHYHLHIHASNSRLASVDDSELERLIAERRQLLEAPQPADEPGMVEIIPPQPRREP